MTYLLLLKKSPDQVGYGLLQTIKTRNQDKARVEVLAARDAWARYDMEWRFRIINSHDYDYNDFANKVYMDDDNWKPNPKLKVH